MEAQTLGNPSRAARAAAWLVPLIAGLTLAACGSDGGGPGAGAVDVGFAGLEPLGADFVYEGWLIVDGAPVSTGRFSVDGDGNPSAAQTADPSAIDAATAYVLTIEPAVGDVPAPSAVHVLAGDLEDGAASLTVDHPAALGTDFMDATGEYVLNTPSTEEEGDHALGIWWLVPGEPFTPGLSLPELPEGWAYEGWVVGPDGPISTGRFTSPDGPDSDLAGPTAGDDGDGPPFPGQDFIDPAMDLTGYAAVISVEPEPDDSPAPFTLKPLVHGDIANVAPPGTQAMANNAAMTNPSGSVVLR